MNNYTQIEIQIYLNIFGLIISDIKSSALNSFAEAIMPPRTRRQGGRGQADPGEVIMYFLDYNDKTNK